MFILIRSIVADSILMMDELCLLDVIINSREYFFMILIRLCYLLSNAVAFYFCSKPFAIYPRY